MAYGEIFLERNLTYLYCTKCDEINICHSDLHTKTSFVCAGLHRKFLLHYELCLETSGNVFLIVFHGLLLLYCILMHFVMPIDFKDIIQCYSKVTEYFASY